MVELLDTYDSKLSKKIIPTKAGPIASSPAVTVIDVVTKESLGMASPASGLQLQIFREDCH